MFCVWVERDWLGVAQKNSQRMSSAASSGKQREFVHLYMKDLVGSDTHFRCGEFSRYVQKS